MPLVVSRRKERRYLRNMCNYSSVSLSFTCAGTKDSGIRETHTY